MNYSELLHDFFDSSLTGTGEETLFNALAVDEELRFELKYLLKLRDAVREDDEANVVPVASTNAIFAQLGYTAPAALVGAAGGIAGTQTGVWTLLKSAGGYLLAMLVGAFITTGLFLWNDSPDEETIAQADRPAVAQRETLTGTSTPSTQTTMPGTSASPQVAAAAGLSGRAPSTTSNVPNVKRSSSQTVASVPVGTRANGRDAAQTIAAENAERNAAEKQIAAEQRSSAAAESSEPASVMNGRADSLVGATPQEDPLANPSTESITPPMTEQRSESMKLESSSFDSEEPKAWRDPAFTISARAAVLPYELKSPATSLPESTQSLDNFAAGVLLPMPFVNNRNFLFVAEVGKESYLLTFTERLRSGREIQHEVMPSVYWFGVGARFNIPLSRQFNPFVQIMGGGSEAGVIGRAMAGLQYSINDQFGMMTGLEYNMAAYRFQGETTASPKLGLNVGLMFNLFGN